MRSMHYIRLIILLLSSTNNYSIEKPWYSILIAQYPMESYIAITTIALTIGALSYNYYQNNIDYEYSIEECRLMYKNTYHSIQHYYNFYHSDAQISDWDLKELIVENKQTSYPFMMYYISLIKASYHLHKYLAVLNQQITKIIYYKKKLFKQKSSEKIAYLQKMFLYLEIRGKDLKKHTLETITLIIILKNRLKLFKEYHNDCHNWSQTTQKIKIICP